MCTVAITSSPPVFSPSTCVTSSLFCKTPTSSCTPSETLKTPSSPSALRLLRLQKPSTTSPGGLIRASGEFSESSSTSPTVLKRKRPARLDIPVVLSSYGNIPATPSVAYAAEALEAMGDGFGVFCKKGRREAMEDRYSALVDHQNDSMLACFGVFDGHGGTKAAEFAAEILTKNIIAEIDSNNDNQIEEAVKKGYLKTDSDFLKEDVWGGSCSVIALIRKGNLVVSNAGDCRAVVSRGGVAEALTSDHRPSRQDERNRIESLGGYVDSCNGIWRVHGSLAVSRGIGDQYLKQWVIAEPETRVLGLEPDLEFLILASDGLWDKVSNQEAVDIARPLCFSSDKPQLVSACRMLVDLSISRGSADDISVMLVELQRFC